MNRQGHVDFGAPSGGITTSDIHRGHASENLPGGGGRDKEEAGDMIRNSQAKNKNPCSRKHSPDGRGVNTIPSVFGFRNNTNKNLILIYHYNHS